ncbi:hypothetical protein JJV70_19735 [Streptomyces sp. JJ66]|nr:hypothetical protein [Streptomyces sp. JJ66]
MKGIRIPRGAVACGAALGLGAALTGVAPANSAEARGAANGRYNAEEIHHFLEGFYGNTGPRAWEREHLVGDDLKRRAEQTEDFDLLMCAQNTPEDIEVGEVTAAQSAGVGWATVRLSWGDSAEATAFTAYVELDGDKPLKLHEVACETPETGG